MKHFIFVGSLMLLSSQARGERLGSCGVDPISVCSPRPIQAFLASRRLVGDAVAGLLDEQREMQPAPVLDASEKTILNRMNDLLGNGMDSVTLVVKSEREEPGFFWLDGQVRVAKTGGSPNEPIYINADMVIANHVDIAEATAILVHELGHHQGIVDHQGLDRLGAKVRLFLEKYLSVSTWPANDGVDVSAYAFNVRPFWNGMSIPGHSRNGRLVLWDGHDYVDITARLWPLLCDTAPYPRLAEFGVTSLALDDERVPNGSLRLGLSLSYICMPRVGIGRNHFGGGADGTLPFINQGPRRILDDTRIHWTVR